MLIWTNTPLSDSIYVINTELRYDPWLFSKALSKAGWSGAQQFNVQVILRASTSDIQFDHQDAYFACWNRKVYLHKFTWILAILAFSSLPHKIILGVSVQVFSNAAQNHLILSLEICTGFYCHVLLWPIFGTKIFHRFSTDLFLWYYQSIAEFKQTVTFLHFSTSQFLKPCATFSCVYFTIDEYQEVLQPLSPLV